MDFIITFCKKLKRLVKEFKASFKTIMAIEKFKKS